MKNKSRKQGQIVLDSNVSQKGQSSLERTDDDEFPPVLVADALTMPIHKDPNCLLGKRFLCRGSGGVIVGASGAGKSSFALQFACHLATGEPFFGIKHPQTKPLKVLLVQAENDDFEIAEVLQSITRDWSDERKQLLSENLHIYCLWEITGEDFAKWLGKRADKLKIDVAFVDPLMSYCGCDVLNNQAMGEFLRQNINSHLKARKEPTSPLMKFGLIFIHHTGKGGKTAPKRGAKATESTSYDMLGASELTNWARFVMNLSHSSRSTTDHRVFDLSVTKRGNRSELISVEDPGSWKCRIQHSSKQGIKPADAEKDEEQRSDCLKLIHWELYSPDPKPPKTEFGSEAVMVAKVDPRGKRVRKPKTAPVVPAPHKLPSKQPIK